MEVLGPQPSEQPPLSTLRSRFGRRLLLLFIGCALLPAIALTVLSSVTINRQLERQSTVKLRQTAAAVSTALLERLLSVQSDLDGLAPVGARVRAGDSLRLAQRAGPLRYKLLGLQFVLGDEHSIPLFRAVEDASDFDAAVAALQPGTARLVVRRAPGAMPRVVLVRALAASESGRRAALLAELDPAFLWGGLREQTRSTTMEVVILDDDGDPLYGPSSASVKSKDLTAALNDRGADTFSWRARGETYLAARHSLYLSGRFVTPHWNVVLREARSDVLAPISSFTRTFPLVVLLSVGVALLLALTQIRRAVAPLRALQDGTRRIAHHEFESRVHVRSRDEFAELASSFNAMAGTLGQQFRALGTAAEIDRAVLSAIDAVAIVDTILERARDVYSCDVVAVTLALEGGAAQSFVEDGSGAAGRRIDRIIIASDDAAQLQAQPEPTLVPLDPSARIAPHLLPLVRHGARAALVVPLVFKDELIGLIALGDATPRAPTAEEIVRARRLAAQTAVALANARMVERVRSLAYYDGVTGLPNRVLYRELLQRALDRGRDEGRQVGVCFVDLDHFGRINDTLGHDIGDQLLREVAGRLMRACRGDQQPEPARRATPGASDDVRAEVARWGGDEFTAILPGLRGARDAVLVAQRILNAFTQPFQLAGHEVFVAASIGIALAPDDGENVETLLKHADVAMYHAKEQGRNVFRLYSRAMHSAALEWIELERDLRRAVPSGEMVLHYQPIVDAKTGRIVAAEALVRWQHPRRGLLAPTQFIPIAEESGLILQLGAWILHTACRELRGWQDAKLPPIRLSVNVSGRQLRDPSLTDTVLHALRESGVSPSSLTLELTESLLMEHGETTVELLSHWRQLGLGLSIDDFGTGYSSLGYLKHFPIDSIKVDRAFVRDVVSAPGDAAITTAVLALGHALDLRVVAEGVETEAQLNFLREQGCDLVQGFFLGRPMPAEEFTRRLQADRDPRSKRRLARLA